MADAATPVTTTKVTDTPAVGLFERLGFRAASGVGEAGWGLDAAGGHRQLHLLLPGALDHPHRLQDLQRRAGGPAEVLFHAHARELRRRCSAAPIPSADRRQDTGFDAVLLQLDLHRRHQRAARAHHRHARRLWLLALSAQGQRHLSFHHPVDAHAAARSW